VVDFTFEALRKGDPKGPRTLMSETVTRHKSAYKDMWYYNTVCRSLDREAKTDERLLDCVRYATTAALLAYPFHDVERVLKTAQSLVFAAQAAGLSIDEEQVLEFEKHCGPAIRLVQMARDIRNSRSIDQYTQEHDLCNLCRMWWEEHGNRTEFKQAGIEISFVPTAVRPATARVCFRLIENICLELLRNVVRHGNGATKIIWRVGHLNDNEVFVDISDDGRGFPEPMLENNGGVLPWVFVVRAGFGIHLIVTKHIIETLHHGKLLLSRSDLGGASVKLVLPSSDNNQHRND
jgi:signal transduction histidine kinase